MSAKPKPPPSTGYKLCAYRANSAPYERPVSAKPKPKPQRPPKREQAKPKPPPQRTPKPQQAETKPPPHHYRNRLLQHFHGSPP